MSDRVVFPRARTIALVAITFLAPLAAFPQGSSQEEARPGATAGAPGEPGRETPNPVPGERGDYLIGVEDVLKVHVFQDEDLRAGTLLTVRPDGKISLPYAGEIPAAGMTPLELRAEIRRRLEPFIPDATVTVIVEGFASCKIFVLGEVRTQGDIVLGRRLQVLQALALAGGLTEFADKNNIELVRVDGERERRWRLEYRKILSGDPDHNLWIRPGDTIIVH